MEIKGASVALVLILLGGLGALGGRLSFASDELTAVHPPNSIARLLRQREWSDASGNFKVRATYAGFDPTQNSVVLQDGQKTRRVPFGKLSQGDQKFVAEYLLASPVALDSLDSEYQKKFALVERELAKVKEEVERLRDERQALRIEVQRLKAFVPGDRLAEDNGIAVVNQNTLEMKGPELLGQTVKLINCKYWDLTDLYQDEIPDTMVCFTVSDEADDSIEILVNRARFGDLILSLRRYQLLNIEGVVTSIRYGNVNYLIEAKTVEKVTR